MKKSKIMGQFLLLAILSLSFMHVSAGDKPSFTGTWKLMKEESKLNDQFSFAPAKVVITQDENNIQIVRFVSMQGQEMEINEKFTLDGKECENSGFQGSKNVSTANWIDSDKSLSISTKIESDFGTMKANLVYTLEGKKLKIKSNLSSDNGDINETWVLEKAE